jgi:hypothetical protein
MVALNTYLKPFKTHKKLTKPSIYLFSPLISAGTKYKQASQVARIMEEKNKLLS